jgi:hypothetical protein
MREDSGPGSQAQNGLRGFEAPAQPFCPAFAAENGLSARLINHIKQIEV